MTARPTRGCVCHLTYKLVAIVLTTLGCNIPVHLTQSSHVLVYSQRFVFCTNQSTLREHLIKDLFGINPTYAPFAKDIEKIIVRGSVYFRVVSVPGDPSAFTIEGHGWHRMYYGMTGDEDALRYLASADYQILEDGPIYFSDLRRASLVMRVRVLNKAYFSRPTLATMHGEAIIFLKIFLKKITEDVYTFDFNREHVVGVISLEGQARVQPIGYMQLVSPSDERNLWDFRRTAPIATDYAAMMTTRIDGPRRQSSSRTLEWLPEYSCQDLRKGGS